MIRQFTLRLLSALLLASMIALPLSVHADLQELDSIVAVVNDEIVTATELREEMIRVIRQLEQAGNQVTISESLRKQVLERMILQKLQLKLAEKQGLRVESSQINQVLQKIADENGLTLLQLRDALEKQGMSYTGLRTEIEQEILLNQVKIRQVDNKVQVSDRELNDYLAHNSSLNQLREYHLKHILISVPEGATAEDLATAKQTIEKLRQRIVDGEDFGELAIANSNGQQALSGGDLGWRKADFLPSLFSDEVMDMEPGTISNVLKSSSGYHLLKLEAVRVEGGKTVRQVKARHILLQHDRGDATKLQERLRQLKLRIAQGESFITLATSNSDDAASAVNGGELGWASADTFVPEFTEQLNKLPLHTISEPFETQFGWHIVEVLEWRDYDNSNEVIRNRAFQALKARKVLEEEQNWVRRLRSEAYIDIRM